MEQPVLSLDMPLPEAGRLLLRQELQTVLSHLPTLRDTADVTGVHETRKAIRRSFTLFRLLAPTYAPGVLDQYRRGLRRTMRRLAPCRDLAIFQLNLASYNETAEPMLLELGDHTNGELAAADKKLRAYLARSKVERFLARYAGFVATPGAGLPGETREQAPILVRHALPGLIFQQLGAVRAYGALLDTATPSQLHQLRIRFKEFRYTLAYFAPLLGDEVAPVIDRTRAIQDHLGFLNDTAVALDLLDRMDCCPEEVVTYRTHLERESDRLIAEFRPLYMQMDTPETRRTLAMNLADL